MSFLPFVLDSCGLASWAPARALLRLEEAQQPNPQSQPFSWIHSTLVTLVPLVRTPYLLPRVLSPALSCFPHPLDCSVPPPATLSSSWGHFSTVGSIQASAGPDPHLPSFRVPLSGFDWNVGRSERVRVAPVGVEVAKRIHGLLISSSKLKGKKKKRIVPSRAEKMCFNLGIS